MRHRMRVLSLAIVVAGLVGCGAPEAPPSDPAVWQDAGDRAYRTGDLLEAERAYRVAFSLYDPRDPAMRERRGALAFATGRSLARAVRDPDAPWSSAGLARRAFDADAWLRLALQIDPDRGWAHLQRARLFDAAHEALSKPEEARAAYEAFLSWQASNPPQRVQPPAKDDPKVLHARKRLEALQ